MRNIVIGKTVDPKINTLCRISEAYDKLGWTIILTLTRAYYSRLVRENYANIEKKTDSFGDIVSIAKGTTITVSKGQLCNLLQVVDVGTRFTMNSKTVTNDPTYDEIGAMQSFNLVGELKARVLNVLKRLIVYLLGFNILPRVSDTHILCQVDLYLYKMVNGLKQIQGVPLVSLIVINMRSVVKTKRGDTNFLYPLLPTMIFRNFGVDLTNEEVEYTFGSHVLNAGTMVSIQFKLVDNTWVCKDEGEHGGGNEEMSEA
ncbi:unnamed protein product [Cuscuta epithymum]|uniref:Putative plant transposon protein domain-containing protein n=1 Tax=Cuscuta epithymum TaxID=186058 RepID=A0AAV0E2E7_9ASTE|nr:unnamed protein product [Cuscuta epithymum]